MEDVKSIIESGKNGFELFIRKFPGLNGYGAKEDLRVADKIVREKIAALADDQKRRMAAVQVKFVNSGKLAYVGNLETAVMRLQQFCDRVRTASYGYAGLTDAVKIREEELDKLYNFDVQLADLCATIKADLDLLEQAVADGTEPSALIDALNDKAKTCIDTFNKRKDVFSGGID